MNRSVKVAVAVLALTSFLAAPSVGLAKSGVDLRAELTPCCGAPEPQAEGKKAELKTQTKNGGNTRVDKLRIEVEIPIPSAGLGITDPAAADIRVVFSRGGGDYAECFMVLDEDEGDKAKFELRIVQLSQNGTTIIKKAVGQCDIDLATAGVQPGVPGVLDGDLATVSSVVAATPIDFLQGTFAQH